MWSCCWWPHSRHSAIICSPEAQHGLVQRTLNWKLVSIMSKRKANNLLETDFFLFIGTYYLPYWIFFRIFSHCKSLSGKIHPRAWLLLPPVGWELPHLSPQHDQSHSCDLCICLFAWHRLLDIHRQCKTKAKKEGKEHCLLLLYFSSISPLSLFYSSPHWRVASVSQNFRVSEMLSPEIAEEKPNRTKTQVLCSKLRMVKSIMLPLSRVFLYHQRCINNLFYLYSSVRSMYFPGKTHTRGKFSVEAEVIKARLEIQFDEKPVWFSLFPAP